MAIAAPYLKQTGNTWKNIVLYLYDKRFDLL